MIAGACLAFAALATPGPGFTAGAAQATPTLRWTSVAVSPAPPALAYAAGAFDSDNSTFVVFGGVLASGALSSDTWVWDGRHWVDHGPATGSAAPPARQRASMAFDPALHQLILFGGRSSDGTLLGDTWAWNGFEWVQLQPGQGGGPVPREDAAFSYDRAGDLVLFGGTAVVSTPTPSTTTSVGTPSASQPRTLADTWLWTANGWVATQAPGPSARSGAALAYDPVSRTTVLFSGSTTPDGVAPAQFASDTWLWDGTMWAARSLPGSPAPRAGAELGALPSAGGLVLFGGSGSAGTLADTWTWTPAGWAASRPAGTSPPALGSAWGSDSSAASIIAFGGAGPGGSPLAQTSELVTTPVSSPPPPTTVPSTPTTASAVTPPATSRPAVAPSSPGTVAGGIVRPPPFVPTAPTTLPGSVGLPVETPAGSLGPGPQIHLDQSRVRRSAVVHTSGSGFEPGSIVTLILHSQEVTVGRVVADPAGDFSATFSVPASMPAGLHHVVATGRTSQGDVAVLAAPLQVLVPAAGNRASALDKAILVLLALVIPGAAWAVMTAAGLRRRIGRRLQPSLQPQ